MASELPDEVRKILGSNEKVLFNTRQSSTAVLRPVSLYITDKRVIWVSPGFLTSNIDSYLYKDIISVSMHKGLLWSSVSITTAWSRAMTKPLIKTIIMDWIPKDDAYTIVKLIQEKQEA